MGKKIIKIALIIFFVSAPVSGAAARHLKQWPIIRPNLKCLKPMLPLPIRLQAFRLKHMRKPHAHFFGQHRGDRYHYDDTIRPDNRCNY
jgi:hypothetical protein